MTIDQLKRLLKKNKVIKYIIYSILMKNKNLDNNIHHLEQMMLNNFRELFAHDPVIHVKEFKGVFAIDVRSDLFSRIILDKKYEPTLVEYCRKYINKSRDVIDVGANIGFYSVMFSKIINNKKVLAIEPTKNALKRLYRNIELNGVANNVCVFEGVVSDVNGVVEIKTIAGKEEYSSIGAMKHPSIHGIEYAVEKVKSITIDELVKQKKLDPGFIKIDCEGAEHLVLQGARRTLEIKRPIILTELSDYLLVENNSSAEQVISFIKNFEYNVFDSDDLSIQKSEKEYGDILCIPKEINVFDI